MKKIYTIYAANKAGTQVVVVPKGFEGYITGAKVTWELVNGRLMLELCPLKPSEPPKEVSPSEVMESI